MQTEKHRVSGHTWCVIVLGLHLPDSLAPFGVVQMLLIVLFNDQVLAIAALDPAFARLTLARSIRGGRVMTLGLTSLGSHGLAPVGGLQVVFKKVVFDNATAVLAFNIARGTTVAGEIVLAHLGPSWFKQVW